jgi:hypothetical protein
MLFAVRQRTVYDTIMILPPHKVWVCAAFVLLGVLTVAQIARAADTQPPSVTIIQPTNGSTVSGIVTILATATANVQVASVSLMLDGATFASPLTSPPFSLPLNTASLANGVHSLLAVATDTAGNASRSHLVEINITNQARYTLGPGPFTVENLGSVLSANTQDKQIMFRLATNNEIHLLLYYDVAAFNIYPFQILDVNITTGTARLTNAVLGRPGPNATCLYNNKVYVASSSPGYFMEYDPITGSVQQIAKLSQNSGQFTEIGDDGWIYIGEEPWGNVDRYNPTSGLFERLGAMDTNGPVYQYAYTVGSDSRYLYVGLGEDPWYLAIYDTQTTNRTIYWQDRQDTGGAVWHGTNGNWYYYRITTNSPPNLWYQLINGQPVATNGVSNPNMVAYNYESGNVIRTPQYFAKWFNTEIDWGNAYPDSGNGNRAVVRWRTIGQTNWQSVTVTNFNIQPINIKRMYCGDNNRLFGFADFYGPVFWYNTADATMTTLGRPQFSLYDALFDGNMIYLSGYPDATLQYDTNLAWILTAMTTNQALSNPSLISARFGKYHYYTTLGSDGFVYIGAHHERDSTGGEIGWYDPINRTNGSLRAPFLNDDVRDVKPALGGTKLVYSSTSTNLFVFDVATKSIERTIVPLPGINMDKVVEVAPGIMFGATASNIFKVNITNGSILYTNTISGVAFGSTISSYDHRLVLGPDGCVWMFIGNTIYRINPTDGSLTKLVDIPAKSLLLKDGDLYLFGGTNLYRIQGVLIPVGPAQPKNLHVLPPF